MSTTRKRKKRKSSSGPDAPIVITESKDFRPIFASGVFGGLDPNDGRIMFFLDRIKPRMKKDPKGAMQLEKVNRELQVEVHMSPSQFASVARWMMEHVHRFEKRMKAGKAGKLKEEPSGTSYIG